MKKTIFRFIDSEEKEQVVLVRKSAFHESYQGSVDLQGLEWNQTDERSIHLGYFDDRTLVSCLRLTFFSGPIALENSTRIPTPVETKFPCALLARAATLPTYRAMGLHEKLRCHALGLTAYHGISWVFGTIEEKVPRKERLLDLGYEIVAQDASWTKSYLKNHGPVLLIALTNLGAQKKAVSALRKKHEMDEPLSFPPIKMIL